MDCKIIYRLSSESYPKVKLPGATKTRCLENFMEAFGRNILVVADNCHRPLLEVLDREKINYLETNLGNAGSFRYVLDIACDFPGDTLVYLVEDDYLHRRLAPDLLIDGIAHADYVTVYDHPDKYGPMYQHGEESKVFRTKLSHWRYTQSTTMTFAARAETLRRDRETWLKHTQESHPHDHRAFTELGRRLAVCIPGAAVHTDLTYSAAIGEDVTEAWAVNYLYDRMSRAVTMRWGEESKDVFEKVRSLKNPLQQLALLSVLETRADGPSAP